MIYIAFFAPIKESSWNESAVAYLIVILAALIVTAVLMTNRFLTKFVFRRIERPLDILVSGVHEIQDGNLAYRIDYHEKDEFYSVCTDFNHMAEQLQRSIEQTEREERSRKELIAGISHDLRTPLTSIKAYIEGLMKGVAQTPERQQKYMRTIREKANVSIAWLINCFYFPNWIWETVRFIQNPFQLQKLCKVCLQKMQRNMQNKA